MNRLQWIALGTTLTAIGVAAIAARPARLATLRVSAITPGSPPIAHVALTYQPGTRPSSLVIDITNDSGSGSITMNGQTLYCAVPLSTIRTEQQLIATTAYYRTIGSTVCIVQQFD
jgi:hypothetical protein